MNVNSIGALMNGVNRAEQTEGSQESSDKPAVKTDALADKEAFLQLLIAQIKNQDPLNPADGLQFLTQLAQFSQLEQLMGIRSDLKAIGDKTGSESDSSSTAAA